MAIPPVPWNRARLPTQTCRMNSPASASSVVVTVNRCTGRVSSAGTLSPPGSYAEPLQYAAYALAARQKMRRAPAPAPGGLAPAGQEPGAALDNNSALNTAVVDLGEQLSR